MPTPILMPALSPTMEKGKLAKWLKREGDNVKAGDVIAEIETDKATMEVEAVDEGKLGKIMVPEGTEDVAVNTPIAMLVGGGRETGGGSRCCGGRSRTGKARRCRCAGVARTPGTRAVSACAIASREGKRRQPRSARVRLAAGAPAGEGCRASTLRRSRARARTGGS